MRNYPCMVLPLPRRLSGISAGTDCSMSGVPEKLCGRLLGVGLWQVRDIRREIDPWR
jgi:hypothetical protein